MYGSGFISFSGNALDLNLYNTNIFMNHVGLTTGATTNWGVWGGEWDDNEIAISAFGGGPLVFDGVRSETTKRLLYFPNAGNARPTTIRNWSGAIPWDQATTYLQDRATVTAATYTASPLPNNPGNGVLTVPASTSLVPLALAGGFVEGDSFVYFQDISHYGLGTVTGWSNRGSTLTVSLESFAPASGGNVNLTNATITSYLNCTVSTTAGTANITLSAPCIEGQENYAIPGAGPGGADLPFYGFVYDSATTGHWSTAISVAAATVTNVRPYSPLNHWGQHQIQVGGGGPYFLVNNQFGVTGHFSVSPTALVVFNFEGNTWPLGEHPLNPAGLYPWPVNPYYSWLTFWSWTRNTWDLTAGTANVNPPVPGSALMPDKASINGQLIANGLSLPGQAGDPAAPANGDVWYNSTTNTFRCMQGGAVVNCIGSVGGTGASDPLNSVQFNNAGNLGGSTGFTYYPDTNPTAVHANNTLNVISHVGAQAGAFFSMDDGTTALPPGTTTDYVVGLDINATMNQTPAPLTGNNEGAIGVGTTVTSGTTQTAADYTWGLDFVVQSDDKPAINCIRGNCRGAIVGIGGDMFTVTPLAATQRSDVYSNKISGLFNNYYSDGTTVSSVGIDWGHFALMVSGGKSWFNGDIVLQPEQAATLAQNVYLWPSTKAVCNASTPGSIWIQGLEQSLGVNPIVTGGTGWAVGNTFTISGPSTVTVPATGVVTQAPGGVVTDFNYTNSGQGYVDNIAAATTATSGTGTGLVLNIVAQTNRGRIHYENNAAGDIMEVCENTSNGYAWVNVGAGGTSPFSITNGSNSLTFTVPPTGSPIISSSTGTVNLSYLYVTDLAGTGTACLQADNLGNVSRTTAPCGTGTAPTAQFLDSQVSVDAVASPAAPWWIGTRSTWLTLGTGSSGGPMTATSPLAANWATALAAGSGGGMYNTNYIANGASNPRYSDITNTTIRVGLYSSASVASLSPADPAGLQFVGFRFVAGTDTNWMCESKDGTTGVYTNSGVLVSPGVWYKLAVVFNNVAHTVDYFIGNALSGSPAHVCGGPLSANLPAAGTVLYPFTVTVGNGTAAENIRIAFVQLIKDW
jgi:hypothetical protein